MVFALFLLECGYFKLGKERYAHKGKYAKRIAKKRKRKKSNGGIV